MTPRDNHTQNPIPKEILQRVEDLREVVKSGNHLYFQTDKSGRASLNNKDNYMREAAKACWY